MTKKRIYYLGVGILGVALIFLIQVVFSLDSPEFLEVNFLDVGQGDSILIEIPQKICWQGFASLFNFFKNQNKFQVLIDGGPDGKVVEKIKKEIPFFDREIEMIFLTHPDSDHINGLFEVLKTYRVKKIFLSEIKEKNELYENFLELAKKRGAETIFVKTGHKIQLNQDANFYILWPKENFFGDVNEKSIVSRFCFMDFCVLLTGDIPNKIEYLLLAQEAGLKNEFKGLFGLKSDVLKVAHHGSKYSTDRYFLEKVNPSVAVISVGENSFGHPTNEVLNLLSDFGIKVLRTDLNGDIKIISDGRDFKIITKKIVK